jgi:transcriptional regulator with XRE-family HTH domain
MNELYAIFDNDKFKEDVVNYRIRQGMTREVLADATGIDINTYANWISGLTKNLSLSTAASLAAICDLKLDNYIQVIRAQPVYKPVVAYEWGSYRRKEK